MDYLKKCLTISAAIISLGIAVFPSAAWGKEKCLDLTGDRIVQIDDIFAVTSRFGAVRGDGNYQGRYDFNKDGVIDNQDIDKIASQFITECPGFQE